MQLEDLIATLRTWNLRYDFRTFINDMRCCAVMAMLVRCIGYRAAQDAYRQLRQRTIPTTANVANMVAEATNTPPAYVLGLNDGEMASNIRSEYYNLNQDYKDGYEHGACIRDAVYSNTFPSDLVA